MNVRKNAVAAGIVLAVSMVCADAAHEKAGGGIAAVDGSCGAGGICLDVTLAPADPGNPDLCGTETALDAVVGEQVNLCYTVTNGSSVDLALQSLEDDVHGPIFDFAGPWTLSAGGSLQFNRIATVGESQSIVSTWSAFSEPPAFDATSGDLDPGTPDICADRVFADGFDVDPIGCDTGTPGDFIDITPNGNVLHLDDDESVPATLPFAFDFYGHASDRICIGNNGYLLFDTTECPSGAGILSGNESLPSAEFPRGAILPFWDDLYTGGAVFTETLGSAPNRFYVVEWWEKNHFHDGIPPIDDSGGVTFEVVLGEDGSIAFNYLKTTFESDPAWDDGAEATIGLQGRAGLFDEFSSDAASLHDQFFVDWTAVDIAQFTDTDAGITINALAPRIDVRPAALDGTAAEGASTTVDLGIGNVGSSDLHWTLDEAAAATLHFPPGRVRIATPLGDPAQASSAPVPIALRRARVNKATPPVSLPQAGLIVPVFAADIYNGQLETFDALIPDTTSAVAPIYGGEAFVGGALIDDDLTRMYAIAGAFGSHPGMLFTINTLSGEVATVGDASNGLDEAYTGLAYDGVTRALYASSSECGVVSHLWTLDRDSGAPTLVGAIDGADCITAIAIDAQGAMYGLDISADALFAIDKTTGDAALIGSIGFDANYAQDMAFDRSTGTLYYAAFNQDTFSDEMRTVNLVDGSTALIGGIGTTLGEVDAMAIETVGGICAMPEDVPWLSAAPSGGTTVPGDSVPVTVTLDAGALVKGEYAANLCVFSDDRTQPVVAVPVSFAVTAGAAIPPSLTKSFTPASVPAGTVSTLTITLINDNATDATLSADLVDAFPHDLVIAATPNESTTCGNGTVIALAGGGEIRLAMDATIPANGSCTITVDVESSLAGDYANSIVGGALQTDFGSNQNSADATLTVEAAPTPPTVSIALSATSVASGTPSTMTVTLANANAVPAALGAPFTIALPANLVVTGSINAPATDCGGALTALEADSTITLDNAGAAIPAQGACSIAVDVVSVSASVYPITVDAGDLQTDAGANADPVSENLVVTGAFPDPYCAITFDNWVEPITYVEFVGTGFVNTSVNTVATGGSAEQSEDYLAVDAGALAPGGAYLMRLAGNTQGNFTDLFRVYFDWNHDGVFASDGSESTDIGSVVNSTGEDGVDVTNFINVPADAKAGLTRMRVVKSWAVYGSACGSNDSGQAEDYLITIDPGAVPPPTPAAVALAIAPDYLAAPGDSATVTVTLTNYNTDAPLALTLPMTDALPGLVIANPANASTTCASGVVTANPGDGMFTLDAGAEIPAGSTCTVRVDVTSATEGIYINTIGAGAVDTANGGNPTPASATVQFASPTGVPTYSADFESFAVADLDGQWGWYAQGVTPPAIATTQPASGAQHAALFSTSSTSTSNVPFVLSPLQLAGTSPYSSLSADVAISHASNGAVWEIVPEDFSLGLAAARVRFDKTVGHEIRVFDFVQNSYVDTGASWTQDAYFHLEIVVERATGTLDVCIDGAPIFHDASGASVAGENVTAAAISQFLQSNTTAANTLFVDNLVVDNAGTPSCGASPSPIRNGKRASDRRPRHSPATSLVRDLRG